VHDGQDPQDAVCTADQRVVDGKPLYWPDGTQYGMLYERYSRACGAAWGYVTGPNSAAWSVHIVARRPADSASAPSSFSGNLPDNSWGNMLVNTRNCVYVEAYVVRAAKQSKTATTECLQNQA
jgi:hypothetical protein